MSRKRINKSRVYHLSQARIGDLNAYVLHIWATGHMVVVMASCVESAVSSLQSWLRATGLDSRVSVITNFSCSDVLSSSSLFSQAECCLNDPKLPL